MPACRLMLLLWTATSVVVGAFWAPLPPSALCRRSFPSTRRLQGRHPVTSADSISSSSALGSMAEKVEVCGFKDCKRAGGGPRLENFIGKLLEEKDLVDSIQVESCDCQGECGYGPNVVVDGRIVNDVKGREAVLKALGIEDNKVAQGFVGGEYGVFVVARKSYQQSSLSVGKDQGDQDLFFEEEFEHEDDDCSASPIEDLEWRVAKLKLEEENTQRFLKARPRFLPYDECRKWVAAWSRWESEKEWKEWIDMGEKRNSYIPARPDEYYGELGQWLSWEHFLGLSNNENENDNEDVNKIGEFD